MNEDIAIEIRDRISKKLIKEGFDIDYNLNNVGIILQKLEDLFFE